MTNNFPFPLFTDNNIWVVGVRTRGHPMQCNVDFCVTLSNRSFFAQKSETGSLSTEGKGAFLSCLKRRGHRRSKLAALFVTGKKHSERGASKWKLCYGRVSDRENFG